MDKKKKPLDQKEGFPSVKEKAIPENSGFVSSADFMADEEPVSAETARPEAEDTAEQDSGFKQPTDFLTEVIEEEQTEAEAPAAETGGGKIKKKTFLRKLRYGGLSIAMTAVVVAGIVLLNLVFNILNNRYPLNIDLTSNKQFTLSAQSVKMAKSITQAVQVVVFSNEMEFSNPNLDGAQLDTVFRQFYETGRQYASLSGGKVSMEYFDPNANPTKAAAYSKYDPTADDTVLFLCGTGADQRYTKISLMDLFSYDQQTYYTYGTLVNFQSLVEQMFAASIRKVTGDLPPAVIFTGHGESTDRINEITTVLKNNGYDTSTTDLTSSAAIDPEATVGILAGPTNDFDQASLTKLQDWMSNNGDYDRHLVVMVDYTSNLPTLYGFLNEDYGIEVTNQIISESDATRYINNDPLQPLADVANTEFLQDLQGKAVFMPVTRRLLTHTAYDTTMSYYDASVVTFPSTAQVLQYDDENATPADADSYPLTGIAYAHKIQTARNSQVNADTYVLVCGCDYYFNTNMLNYYPNNSNVNVFMAVYDKMVSGALESLNIDPLSLDPPTLSISSGAALWVGVIIFTVGLPVIILGIGVTVYLRRRHL